MMMLAKTSMLSRCRPAAVALSLGASALPTALAAHPHIFVETELKLVFDPQGRAAAVEVAWRYDDFYTMLLLDEYGFDLDGDGQLTEAEQAKLQGFDMNWEEGFEGDLVVSQGGKRLTLGPPEPLASHYDGISLHSRHRRALLEPVVIADDAGAALSFKPFDLTYYTAYHMSAAPMLEAAPEGCTAALVKADLAAANTLLESLLQQEPPEDQFELDYPAVGEAYADEGRVTCPAR